MKIISFIKDPPVIYKILDPLDLLEASGHDLPRSPPKGGRTYEPFYDDMPYGDEVTFSG